MTGEFQLMPTTAITLPDGSVVHNAGRGCFQISYPDQPTLSVHGPLSISDDHQWIVGAVHDCWIPSHYRDYTRSFFFGDRIFFADSSANVVIFDMKVAQ